MNRISRAAISALIGLSALTGCSIAPGEPIGTSRLVTTPNAAGKAGLTARSCPDWQRDSGEDFSNRTASNFGCADAVNFLGELANPADAISGRAVGSEEGAAAAGAVERYRLHKVTPLSASHGGDAGSASAGAGAAGNPS